MQEVSVVGINKLLRCIESAGTIANFRPFHCKIELVLSPTWQFENDL